MTAVSTRASHDRATAAYAAGSATELDDAFVEQVRERLLAEGGAITDTRIATAVRETGRVLGAVGSVRTTQVSERPPVGPALRWIGRRMVGDDGPPPWSPKCKS